MDQLKQRILIIDNSLDTTGAFKSIINYCLFARDQFDFVFIFPQGSKASPRAQAQQFQVIEFPIIELSKSFRGLILYLPRLIQNSFRLSRVIKENQIALVHVNDFYNLIAIVSKMLGNNFILTTHVRFMPDRFPFLKKVWISLNLKYADAIVCVSGAVKQFLPNHPKIHIIHDGLLEQYGSYIPNSKRDTIQLLYLSHYIKGKGQNFAIEGFHLAFRQNANIRLKFVGGDMGLNKNKDFKKSLISRVKALDITHVVQFSDQIDDVRKEFENADILLNFSESESFSMTCLEALSLGVPLIVSDSGGPSELFLDGESGMLIPNRNINSMAAAIVRLSMDGNLRRKFSINGLKLVRDRFAPENTYGVLLNLQLRLLGRNAS